MKRTYLAIFGLPKPQWEHAQIVEVILAAAVGGDFKQFPVPGGMGFMYESETLPWNMPFGRVLMNNDTSMIVEVGEKVSLTGYGAAAGWLNVRRPRQ